MRQVREKAGLSQSEFASRVGVSRGAISTYELGDRVPDIRFLDKVIEEFGCSYEYLIGRAEAMSIKNVSSSIKTGLNDEALEIIDNSAHLLNAIAIIDRYSLRRLLQGLGVFIAGDLYQPQNKELYSTTEECIDMFDRFDGAIHDIADELIEQCQRVGYAALTDQQRSEFRQEIKKYMESMKQPSAESELFAGLRAGSANRYETACYKLINIDDEYRRNQHAS